MWPAGPGLDSTALRGADRKSNNWECTMLHGRGVCKL